MNRLAVAFASAILLGATPSLAQTVGSCSPGPGSTAASAPVWVMFDLGSAQLRADDKPKIAQAVATAKARQSTRVCLVGQTDKLGDKAMNEKLAMARSRAVATEMIRVGYPAANLVIASNPEAFGDLSVGSADSQEKDRRVTIVFR